MYVDLDPVISKFDWGWWGLHGNTGNTFNCFIMSLVMFEDNILRAIYAIWFRRYRSFQNLGSQFLKCSSAVKRLVARLVYYRKPLRDLESLCLMILKHDDNCHSNTGAV